jgi:hypothetical protein
MVFALFPASVSQALGTPPTALIRGIGFVLLANAAHLAIAARRSRIWPLEVLWFALGDLLWWLASLALVASGLWVTTAQGIVATLAVACVVAAFGTAQLFALGQHRTGLTGSELWRRLGASWMALRPGVKAWLVFLNLVFLSALAVWPSDAARVPLLAYVASGPLLLGMAAAQGGLTRALGLAHLPPFGALLLWSVPQATAGPYAPYLALLSLTVAICLAFDLWDLARYAAGDRKPFLPPEG